MCYIEIGGEKIPCQVTEINIDVKTHDGIIRDVSHTITFVYHYMITPPHFYNVMIEYLNFYIQCPILVKDNNSWRYPV